MLLKGVTVFEFGFGAFTGPGRVRFGTGGAEGPPFSEEPPFSPCISFRLSCCMDPIMPLVGRGLEFDSGTGGPSIFSCNRVVVVIGMEGPASISEGLERSFAFSALIFAASSAAA
jgi:hypothetical protein